MAFAFLVVIISPLHLYLLQGAGQRNRIHISEDTARLLKIAGKSHWFKPREDKVVAKGKGELTTFWLLTKEYSSRAGSSVFESERNEEVDTIQQKDVNRDKTEYERRLPPKTLTMEPAQSAKLRSLIGWNCDVLLRLLRQIVATRENAPVSPEVGFLEKSIGNGSSVVLDEVEEFISLPKFSNSALMKMDPNKVELSREVVTQLREYVTAIASLYHENPFHNFEHASHVMMSVVMARFARDW